MEMYGDTCNIPNEVRGWFKDPSLKTWVLSIGRSVLTYSKALTENPLQEDPNPENPN